MWVKQVGEEGECGACCVNTSIPQSTDDTWEQNHSETDSLDMQMGHGQYCSLIR